MGRRRSGGSGSRSGSCGLTSGSNLSVKTTTTWGRTDLATLVVSRCDEEVEQMAPVRRKSKGGGGEEEAGGCTGEGEDEGRRRWQPALGRRQKGAFYIGSQLGLCLVGCFLFS
jgi:hypothetical protein